MRIILRTTVTKFLFGTEKEKRNNRHAAPLRGTFSTVIERMNNADVDLDLQSLANRIGYSRITFCVYSVRTDVRRIILHALKVPE